MAGSAESSDARKAGLYLAELLKREPYRSRWDRPEWKIRARQSDLHHTAIAHVLGQYLRIHPREGRKNDSVIEPIQLGSLVSNALTGKRLSSETLRIFISAFYLLGEHADRLWRIYNGSSAIHMVSAGSGVPVNAPATPELTGHITRYVHDYHYLGPNGIPYKHETMLVIDAKINGVDRYVYAFDADYLTVEVLTGGTLGAPYATLNNIRAIDILFGRSLEVGETHLLKLQTTFRYKSSPPPEFRRFSIAKVEYEEVKIIFHRTRLPKSIWEADWNATNNFPTLRAAVLDGYGTVTRYIREAENTGFGYVWKWR